MSFSIEREVLYDDIADYLSPDKSNSKKFDEEETVTPIP